MKKQISPLGVSLGAGAAIAALAFVVHGPVANGPGMSGQDRGSGAIFGVASAGAAEPVGEPQRLPVSDLTIMTASGERRDFAVEVARTSEEHAIGLMFRHELADEAGMLFLFPAPRRASFWMRNTYIPLDLIFIGPDGRIESIQPNATPHSLKPIQSKGSVIAVLEIAGGLSERLGLTKGDRVIHAELPRD